jgi:hypothetical protein
MKKIIILFLAFAPFFAFTQNIPMTFHNGSFALIYLNIPESMNPNLSSKSNSVVSLDVGQVVYFFPKGKNNKKEILFIVSPTWKEDTILQIDEIIKTRKKNLGYYINPCVRKTLHEIGPNRLILVFPKNNAL